MHIPSRFRARQSELFSPPAKLLQLPPETHRKMVRLLARMLNEHLRKSSSSSDGHPEVGDE